MGISPFFFFLKKKGFSAVYDSLYLYKIDYKNYTFLHKHETNSKGMNSELNCIVLLFATLG